jgi:arabinose-5-phosphate isomerase
MVQDAQRLEVARSLVAAEAAGLQALAAGLDQQLIEAARMVLSCGGKVVPTGVGTSGETARRMSHLLSVAGSPSLFLHPTDGLHGGLGAITQDDLIIAISKGGESDELNEFTRRAKERGAGVIVLTADAASSLAKLGDLIVVIKTAEGSDPAGIIAMGSTLAASAWGDALALVTMQMRGYDWDEVLFTHPGGAVGQRAASALSGPSRQAAPSHEV